MSESRPVSSSSVSLIFSLRDDSFPLLSISTSAYDFHVLIPLFIFVELAYFISLHSIPSSFIRFLCIFYFSLQLQTAYLFIYVSIFFMFRNVYIFPSLSYMFIYSSVFTTYCVFISIFLLINSISIFSFNPAFTFSSLLPSFLPYSSSQIRYPKVILSQELTLAHLVNMQPFAKMKLQCRCLQYPSLDPYPQ